MERLTEKGLQSQTDNRTLIVCVRNNLSAKCYAVSLPFVLLDTLLNIFLP